jgi:hypothetical protein
MKSAGPLHLSRNTPARNAPAPPRGLAPRSGASRGDAEGGATPRPSLAHAPCPVACLAHDLGLHRHRRRHRRNIGGRALSDLGTVLLLEAETALAYHASGRSAALYEANYGHPVTIALNKASRADHDTLDGGFLSPRGLMLLGGPGEEATAEADIDTMALVPISPEEARARVPILDPEHVTRAGFTRRPGTSTPTGWCSISQGRSAPTAARCTRATGHGDRARRRPLERHGIGRDRHSGRVILNAAGAWADGIARMAGVDAAGAAAAPPVDRAHAGARRP